jgi:hypothetical protein
VKDERFWREAVGQRTATATLAEAEAPEAPEQAAAERLLIRAAQAGNALTPEQVSRVRRLARERDASGADAPAWRQMVEAAPSMLTEAA